MHSPSAISPRSKLSDFLHRVEGGNPTACPVGPCLRQRLGPGVGTWLLRRLHNAGWHMALQWTRTRSRSEKEPGRTATATTATATATATKPLSSLALPLASKLMLVKTKAPLPNGHGSPRRSWAINSNTAVGCMMAALIAALIGLTPALAGPSYGLWRDSRIPGVCLSSTAHCSTSCHCMLSARLQKGLTAPAPAVSCRIKQGLPVLVPPCAA